jgi:hypothetical protein
MKSKMFEIFEAPEWLRILSECTGPVLSLIWLGYVVYVSVVNHLGWPASDEQFAILAFAAEWVYVRICFGLIGGVQGRMVSNG